MITICKHQIYPQCAIVVGCLNTVFSKCLVHRSPHCLEDVVSSCQYLQAFQTTPLPASQRARKSCSVCDNQNVYLFQFLRGCWVCRQKTLIQCVCVCVDSNGLPVWSEKGLPGWWKQAVCSCPERQNGWGHRWDFSLVNFSSDLASLCLKRHGNLN